MMVIQEPVSQQNNTHWSHIKIIWNGSAATDEVSWLQTAWVLAQTGWA
jgi:hypothetical protein